MDGEDQIGVASRRVIIAFVVACLAAGLTLSVERIESGEGWLIILLVPGMLGSMIVSNNVHAFALWLASVFNFFFYFILIWGVIGLGSRLFRKKVSSSLD